MKFHFSSILIVCLFSLLTWLSFLLSSQAVQPYSSELMYNGMYPYEGFRNNELSNTSYPEYKILDDGKNDQSSPLKKVVGFNGLLSSPDYITKSNDLLLNVNSSQDCNSQSYGYTNLRGFVCMDPNQVNLLVTRGGNG